MEAAFKRNLLTKDQWDLWQERYENKDHYLGYKYEADSTWNFYKQRNDYDLKSMKEQVIDFKLPGKPFYKK